MCWTSSVDSITCPSKLTPEVRANTIVRPEIQNIRCVDDNHVYPDNSNYLSSNSFHLGAFDANDPSFSGIHVCVRHSKHNHIVYLLGVNYFEVCFPTFSNRSGPFPVIRCALLLFSYWHQAIFYWNMVKSQIKNLNRQRNRLRYVLDSLTSKSYPIWNDGRYVHTLHIPHNSIHPYIRSDQHWILNWLTSFWFWFFPHSL